MKPRFVVAGKYAFPEHDKTQVWNVKFLPKMMCYRLTRKGYDSILITEAEHFFATTRFRQMKLEYEIKALKVKRQRWFWIITLGIMIGFLCSCSQSLAPRPDPEQSIAKNSPFTVQLSHLLSSWGEFSFYYQEGFELEVQLMVNWTPNKIHSYNGPKMIYTVSMYKWINNNTALKWLGTERLTPINGYPLVKNISHWEKIKQGDEVYIEWRVESKMVKECQFTLSRIIGRVK